MLRLLKLRNFRGFEEHELPLSSVSIVVGRNNAGKSTIVEALRLLSIVAARYRGLTYKGPPKWLDVPAKYVGVSPSLRNMEINFDSLFYQYGDPPSEIYGEFTDGSSITLYLAGEDNIHAVIRADGKIVTSNSIARSASIPAINIMPQVAPVQSREVILSEDYVKGAMSSRLAPLHFRNQIRLLGELFPMFQSAVEETWPGVQIKELVQEGNKQGDALYLQIRNEDFVADVATMGHGLQMWLQTIWFLTRAGADSTIILDEPDVYMHADLQRRLIRYLRGRHKQIVVATHSIEIMSEVDPAEILVVERKRKKSNFATSLPAVQRVVSTIGSAQNVQLTKLWTARRTLLLEGKDLKLLKAFQDALYPDSSSPLDSLPNMSIGGWGGWNYAIGSSMMLKNALGEDVLCYCLLDSDYHTDETIQHRYKQATERAVNLHIWRFKEIESYLLNSRALHSAILARAKKGSTVPSAAKIDLLIDEFAEKLRDEAFDATASELLTEQKGLGQGGANKLARERLKQRTKTYGLRHVVSGKEILAMIGAWAQKEFGANINPLVVSKEMRPIEIHDEVREVLGAIEKCQALAPGC